MNKLYNELAGNIQTINQTGNSMVNEMANAYKNSTNPEQLLVNLARQNPNIVKILEMIKSSNKSPKELFYEMAAQKGVDPNQILGMLK